MCHHYVHFNFSLNKGRHRKTLLFSHWSSCTSFSPDLLVIWMNLSAHQPRGRCHYFHFTEEKAVVQSGHLAHLGSLRWRWASRKGGSLTPEWWAGLRGTAGWWNLVAVGVLLNLEILWALLVLQVTVSCCFSLALQSCGWPGHSIWGRIAQSQGPTVILLWFLCTQWFAGSTGME